MTNNLDTLATALYVKIDDLLKESPERAPRRPVIGIPPKLTAAELVTLAVIQALRGFTSESRWLRMAVRPRNEVHGSSAISCAVAPPTAGPRNLVRAVPLVDRLRS